MESCTQSTNYNLDLVQKYNIVDLYSANYRNKKHTNHSLHKGRFGTETVYSLYIKNGKLMILVDAFKSLNDANDQAKSIINNHPELVKILNFIE
ncbi:hypothetical protein [Xenorhabdus kozodoii]|uniref:Uncharacterized protein n=1 Tax=Xenorhabdus kozodoii TaxID=351676 RepID=A0A2D0KY17_9GAMM|nr:hypothetical protein [Xenorhabdus kozodoii]PHM68323.1 hypothetical protein Xkoz_03707 [Xenorhabdus kozodoii]